MRDKITNACRDLVEELRLPRDYLETKRLRAVAKNTTAPNQEGSECYHAVPSLFAEPATWIPGLESLIPKSDPTPAYFKGDIIPLDLETASRSTVFAGRREPKNRAYHGVDENRKVYVDGVDPCQSTDPYAFAQGVLCHPRRPPSATNPLRRRRRQTRTREVGER